MRRLSVRIVLAIFGVLIFLAICFLWGVGINVTTTAESFAARAEMPLFEIRDGVENVRLAVTPAPWPEEARSIYRAASIGIPVKVRLQSTRGTAVFIVEGLSAEQDFLIPCETKVACKNILNVAGSPIPSELTD